jgi:hypothetical protein
MRNWFSLFLFSLASLLSSFAYFHFNNQCLLACAYKVLKTIYQQTQSMKCYKVQKAVLQWREWNPLHTKQRNQAKHGKSESETYWVSDRNFLLDFFLFLRRFFVELGPSPRGCPAYTPTANLQIEQQSKLQQINFHKAT